MFARKRTITYNTPQAVTNEFYAHLIKQPHILIAGCTGSGKSVLENALLHELLLHGFDNSIVLIDPKMVELSPYKHIPHCIGYADNTSHALFLLDQVNATMMERYTEMQAQGKRQYEGGHIYVLVDELADILTDNYRLFYPKLQKILQLGRAANVHLWGCTQNPSKALLKDLSKNFTDRIALRCQSSIESRQIINEKGAEMLEEYGFCLYLKNGHVEKYPIIRRTDLELENIIKHWENVYYRK